MNVFTFALISCQPKISKKGRNTAMDPITFFKRKLTEGRRRFARRFLPGLAVLLASCAGTPEAPPEWVLRTEAVYPRERYIAQIGRGKTKNDAELAALSEIAYYFETQISAELSMSQSITSGPAGDTEISQIDERIRVESQLKFAMLRYAETPYFDRAAGQYVTAAYMERDEAWGVYEKNVTNQTGAFMELARSAEAEADPFSAALRYRAAEAFSRSEEFTGVWDFARILHPVKAAAAYRESEAFITALPEKLYTARRASAVFIDCPRDYEGLVYQAAVKAFSAEGFTVEADRRAAESVCSIRIDEGLQETGGGFMYYPALSASINGKRGVILSFSVKAERAGAVTPEVAKRRAYSGLAAALSENFAAEVDKSFFGK
jgi:hypothetical protein